MNQGTEPRSSMSAERAIRWAVLSSLRVLRLSIHHRGPMSLPNLLRLFRRRVGIPPGYAADEAARAEGRLAELYLAHQPFNRRGTGVLAGLRPH